MFLKCFLKVRVPHFCHSLIVEDIQMQVSILEQEMYFLLFKKVLVLLDSAAVS